MIDRRLLKGRSLKSFVFKGVVVFYHDGVTFDCAPEWNCYECCKTPADLNEDEYRKLVNLGYSNFAYKLAPGIYKFKEKNGACIFLKDNSCSIHKHKPASCRAQPFIPILFDFHSLNLNVAIEPNAYDWCYGLKEGEMDKKKLELAAEACKKLFLDRVRYYENFKSFYEAFLIAALSIPEKVGLIAESPMRSLCFSCGFPLKIAKAYDIYNIHPIKRDYFEYKNVLICEKCREKMDKVDEDSISALKSYLFSYSRISKYFKI